jgi:Fic family protein
MNPLAGTPYVMEDHTWPRLSEELDAIDRRADLLRDQGTLTSATLARFYSQSRYEQVAESNGIENNPLDVGETQLAVETGTTLTGRDPRHIRDARSLFNAVDRLTELARANAPGLLEVKEIHELIMDGQPGAGELRRERVQIVGQQHTPPKTYEQVLRGMEDWERWSHENTAISPLLRGVVLHTWLTHIHPFTDGNGRTARAICTLEMIRGGLPPLIIRRNKDKPTYLEALARSDEGDIGPICDLFLRRAEHALDRLERAAREGQGYDPVVAAVRQAQERRTRSWNAAVELLLRRLDESLADITTRLGGSAKVDLRLAEGLDVEDFVALCEKSSRGNAWLAIVSIDLPALPRLRRLLWIGFRDPAIDQALTATPAPAIFWSEPNPDRYPPWRPLSAARSPGGGLLTLVDDDWVIVGDGAVLWRGPVSKAGSRLAEELVRSAAAATG